VAEGPEKKGRGIADIGILNGPAEDGTRGLLKAHDPKFMKPESLIKR
jgi:hypothetical protein